MGDILFSDIEQLCAQLKSSVEDCSLMTNFVPFIFMLCVTPTTSFKHAYRNILILVLTLNSKCLV